MHDKCILIDEYIAFCRNIFSELACISNTESHDFRQLITDCFQIDFENYEYVLDCFYLFQDTSEANKNYRKYGLNGPTIDSSVGERYLRFYGIMNSCYLQREGIICCYKKLGLPLQNEKSVTNANVFEFRNSFAAHSPDRKGRSFVLCRMSLEGDIVKGYSWNSGKKDEKIFKKQSILELLNEWDTVLLQNIKEVANHFINSMKNPKKLSYINVLYEKFRNDLNLLNSKFNNPDSTFITIVSSPI